MHLLPFDQGRSMVVRSRGYLPHWELDDSTYFVTFRLVDSLPLHIVRSLKEDQERIRKMIAPDRPLTALERHQARRTMEKQLDQYLDLGHGECHLRDPRIANVVAESLRFKDRVTYELWAWCIMPNHVHVLFDLRDGRDLAKVLGMWKSYTAHQATRILSCKPPFWQPEYFDRIVRDQKDLEDTREYVMMNPRRAGLVDWPWVWRR